MFPSLCIGDNHRTVLESTVDCTIPKYIWTSAQMTTLLEEPIGESNMVKLPGHVYKNIQESMTGIFIQNISKVEYEIFAYLSNYILYIWLNGCMQTHQKELF